MNKPLMYSGFHAVEALLRHRPEAVLELFVQDSRAEREEPRLAAMIQSARDFGIAVQRARREVLEKHAGPQHQGIVARARPRKPGDESGLLKWLDGKPARPWLLILENVTDPHNLGACLRTADAVGVQAVVVPKDKSASLSPTVRKVACGAAETVPLVRVTNLARFMRTIRDDGVWLIGTAGEADNTLYQADFTGPVALVMGAEGKGMRRLTREHCDLLINIPMLGHVDSLNVSVATGVCLYEALRQRLA